MTQRTVRSIWLMSALLLTLSPVGVSAQAKVECAPCAPNIKDTLKGIGNPNLNRLLTGIGQETIILVDIRFDADCMINGVIGGNSGLEARASTAARGSVPLPGQLSLKRRDKSFWEELQMSCNQVRNKTFFGDECPIDIPPPPLRPPTHLPPDVDPVENCTSVLGRSPIVLDLGAPGFELTSVAEGVRFDLDADGVAEATAWTAAGARDAFLVLDRNANGTIDDGSELFGNSTLLSEGMLASNGYVALRELDSDANGFIDPVDPSYDKLRVWTDRNHNGISEHAELTTLRQDGIVAIYTGITESSARDNHGNTFRWLSIAYQRVHSWFTRPILTSDVYFVEEAD